MKKLLTISVFWACATTVVAETAQERPSARYLAAVRTFADNVLAEGRDTYGPKHTPLFVDGLHIDTREPAKWKLKGQEWILSNQASQQNLFRTLVGLSRITGDARYRDAAVAAVRYQFDHLVAPNGLLYWGGHCAYDARTEELVGETHGGRLEHELKRHYPWYEFMWEVDPEATRRFVETFWGRHIIDWSNLCFNRHGRYDRKVQDVWSHEYLGGPMFLPCEGLTFVTTGSDLYYAAGMLARLSGDSRPLVWARRLAYRYVETRNPTTLLPGYQFTQYRSGDRAKKQFGPEWGDRVLEGTLLAPGQSARQFGDTCPAAILLGEALGERGADFRTWGLSDLAAYAKHAYIPESNAFAAVLTDGTRLTSADIKRKGYFGQVGGHELDPHPAGADLMWAYALAYRSSGDAVFWTTVRSMARALDLGDIGDSPTKAMQLNLSTSCAAPEALLAVLELYERRREGELLRLACRIGGNLLEQHFQKGLFVNCADCVYAKFDSIDPLVLLRLAATLDGEPGKVPTIWPGRSYFHCDFDGMERTYDNHALYARKRGS